MFEKYYNNYAEAMRAAQSFEENLIHNIKKVTYKSTSKLSASGKRNCKAILNTALVMLKNSVRKAELDTEILDRGTGWQSSDYARSINELKYTFIKVNKDGTFSAYFKGYPIYNVVTVYPFKSVGYVDNDGNIVNLSREEMREFKEHNYIPSALERSTEFERVPYFNVNIANVLL
jgi:hypothetical protein